MIFCDRFHAAHLTNNETWEELTSVAGRASGDLSFPLVYTPELHFQEFTSAVADMKNSVAVSQALALVCVKTQELLFSLSLL